MRPVLALALLLAPATAASEMVEREGPVGAIQESPRTLEPAAPAAPSAVPAPAQMPPPNPPVAPPYPWYPPQPAPYPWYPPPYPPYQGYPAPAPLPPPAPAETPAPPAPANVVVQPEPAHAGPYPSRASWSLQLESAQGVATGKFDNALLAGHIDYMFASRLKLGGYLAIANLKGKERRVSALLPCALVTYEKPPAPGRSLSLPLQFATGYLMQNGPVARLSAGLAWAVGQRTDLVFTAGPMVWVTRDDMLLSVDVAVELRFRPLGN